MRTTRAIFVEGHPGSGRSRLAQALALQFEALGRPHRLYRLDDSGHPLVRPWKPEEYTEVGAWADVLEVQWRNFATRAAQGDDVILFDAALLQPALRQLLAEGRPVEELVDLTVRLLDSLDALEPTVLYLSLREAPPDAAPDWEDWRTCCDRAFGTLEQHRLLLNASLAEPDLLLADALEFLDLPHRNLAQGGHPARLAGAYQSSAGRVEIRATGDDDAMIRLPPVLDAGHARPLLAAADGSVLVTGTRLRLSPRQEGGRITGLLARSEDTTPIPLDHWLPRIEE